MEPQRHRLVHGQIGDEPAELSSCLRSGEQERSQGSPAEDEALQSPISIKHGLICRTLMVP